MLLTKREEQLVKAFLEYGKLSIDNLTDLLKVSKRTVYRALTELGESLAALDVAVEKEDSRYFLSGQLDQLTILSSQETYTRVERLNLIAYRLLMGETEWTNEQLQTIFLVSNVTIIQDIVDIEKRLSSFGVGLVRKKGYQLVASTTQRRRLLAILLVNNIRMTDFRKREFGAFSDLDRQLLEIVDGIFKRHQEQLPEMDAKLSEFFTFLLYLTKFGDLDMAQPLVSKLALEVSQKVYTDLAKQTGEFYSISEILYFASVLDECLLKRQETPLFQENFDSVFFYSISNLIDKVALYTKIAFTKDRLLFQFLFNHIRLSLAVPVLFPEASSSLISQGILEPNDYLHRVVTLLIGDIFPDYLKSDLEYELITLHFAASLRRSPDIYPIRLLLLTDERPLATELLVTRLKHIAPFVGTIVVKPTAYHAMVEDKAFDAILSTKLLPDERSYLVSGYPDGKELVQLQEYLQRVQGQLEVVKRDTTPELPRYNVQHYLQASQALLASFQLRTVVNAETFEQSVYDLLEGMPEVQDSHYLANKLYQRFMVSPMAIPETGLALLHTQSSRVLSSGFSMIELKKPVMALSMTHEEEEVSRVLLMLTKRDEMPEIRDFMTAISQSLIENNLYTEIYKTGNQEIIYQLLNHIFTEKIKKLEN